MDLTPQIARTVAFRIVRKGYDPLEVDTFREQAAAAIEEAQNQATAMEARARAAVAKLNELSQSASPAGGTPAPVAEAAPVVHEPPREAPSREHHADAPARPRVSDDDAHAISQALILAQRTAESTVAEAKAKAASILADAEQSVAAARRDAEAEAARVVDAAREHARKQVEGERLAAENEVQALLARRDFLVGDVEHLETHLAAERQRVRAAADALLDVAERNAAGLAENRRPLLSASDAADSTSTAAASSGDGQLELDGENTGYESAPQ